MARQTRRKSARHSKRSGHAKRSSHAKRSTRGGGFSVDPSKFVSVGNPVNQSYTGAGKDCVGGDFVRPGFISNYGASGVPGMSGGKRRARGGYQLAVAPMEPVASVVQLPSAPGVPPHTQPAMAVMQKGGRYESNPGALLDGGSDIGMKSYAGAHSIPCERGSINPLNMHGGAVPTVAVGAADSMQIRMPTAGYGHAFETYPGVSAVGGLMLNTAYDARAFNPACNKTGGGPVADGASPYAPLDAGQITGRGGFDGSNGLLPMKYGGKRRKHSIRHKHSRRCKHSSRRKHSSRK